MGTDEEDMGKKEDGEKTCSSFEEKNILLMSSGESVVFFVVSCVFCDFHSVGECDCRVKGVFCVSVISKTHFKHAIIE